MAPRNIDIECLYPRSISRSLLRTIVSSWSFHNAQRHTISELKLKKGLGKRVAYIGEVSALYGKSSLQCGQRYLSSFF